MLSSMSHFKVFRQVLRSSPVLQVFTASFSLGAVIGFKDCDVSDFPMITERCETAFLLGGCWAGHTLFMPFKIAYKLDSLYHGRTYDLLDGYKETHKIMTGSWRHDRRQP